MQRGAESWADLLQRTFEVIWRERMHDVPVLHPGLRVETVGFRDWEGHVLGILVTPWFMNIMLLPGPADDWGDYRCGTKQTFTFPAGELEFVIGEEAGLGKFLSCSLFSPMHGFENHEAAILTAKASLDALFDEPQGEDVAEVDTETTPSISETVLAGVEAVGKVVQQNMHAPFSRRELLRGAFLRARGRSVPESESG